MEYFSISLTFSRAIQLMRMSWRSAGLFILIVLILSQIVQGASMLLPQAWAAVAVGGNAEPAGWQVSLWLLLSLAFGAFSWAGSLHTILAIGEGRTATLGQCFQTGFAKCLPTFGLIVLWLIGVVLGWAIFTIPGIILICAWSVTLPVLIGEGRSVLDSFGRSRDLTRGYRGKIFFTLLIFVVASYALLFAVVGAMSRMITADIGGYGQFMPVLVLLTVPVIWAWGTFLATLLATIYLELVTIKEGGRADSLVEVFE